MMSINDTLGEFELEFEGIGGVPIWVRLIGEMVKTKGDEHAVDFMKSLLKGSDDLEVLQTWLSRNVGGFRKVWHRSLAINLETDLEAHWRGESIIENIGMENAVGIIRYPYSGLPWNNFTIFNHMLPTPESRDFQVPPEYVKAVSKQIGPWVFDKQRSSYGVAQRLVRWLIEEADTRSGKLLFSQSIINLMRAHLTIPEDIKLKDGRGALNWREWLSYVLMKAEVDNMWVFEDNTHLESPEFWEDLPEFIEKNRHMRYLREGIVG
jgi:hypothetical protein